AAGLANHQSALLKIAGKRSPKAQLRQVKSLAKNGPKRLPRPLSPEETKQFKSLKRAFRRAQKFKKAWRSASRPVRGKFIKTVLQQIDVVEPSRPSVGLSW